MELFFRLDGTDDDAELRSLLRWIRDEDELRGVARADLVAAPPTPGEMGGSLEAIKLVIDSSAQLTTVAVAVGGWWKNRRGAKAAPMSNPVDLVIERDGSRISVSGATLEEATGALEEIKKFLEGEDGASS